MKTVITLTLNPAVDISTSTDNVQPEDKLRCATPKFDPGGGGINVSRAMHNLGGAALAVFTSGGHAGHMLEGLLRDAGLPIHPVPVSGITRENFTVIERSSNDQYRFNMPGAALTADELTRCTAAVLAQPADYLVASGSLTPGVPDDYYARLTQQARDRGMRVIVDTSGPALQALRGARPYLLKPNIGELETFSGTTFHEEEDLQRAGQQLIAEGLCEVLVVSLGAAGAALITADQFVRCRPPLVRVQSRVGAGDSMVGGLVLALARGDTPVEAVKLGVAAGTAAVMSAGTDLCRREDVEKLLPRVTVS
ncbi:MAG: 1-phosphofructokinase family hexose kinase [Anaerolineae bacterium]|nr:1-phosphofructokinase family hexose kinase [Anaerolineae bacterium]